MAGGIPMTEQKHLKALIRARMARTGESYTAARRHIVKAEARPSLTPTAEFRAHDKHCMTAVFTPDDTHLISGGFGGQARIWTLDGTSRRRAGWTRGSGQRRADIAGRRNRHHGRVGQDGPRLGSPDATPTVRARQASQAGAGTRPRRAEGPCLEWRPRWSAERVEPRLGGARGGDRPRRVGDIGGRASA